MSALGGRARRRRRGRRAGRATARLRGLLLDALRHGRAELAPSARATTRPSRSRSRPHGGLLLAATPAGAGAARRPRAGRRARVAARRRRRRRARRPRRARRRPPTPRTSALRAGELDGLPRRSRYPRRGSTPATLDELGPLAFDEHVARHRPPARRARCARPGAACSPTSALREPIGAGHPLRIAEAVARLGGRPADPARSRSTRRPCSRCSARTRGARVAPARGPRSGAPRRAPDPPAARRDGQVGRLPHGLRPPRARLRRQRPRARPGRSARRCSPPGCWPRSRPSASATCSSTRAAPRDIQRADRDAATRHRGCGCPDGEIDRAPCRSPSRRAGRRASCRRSPRSPRPGIIRPQRPDRLLAPAVALRPLGRRRRPPATRPPPRAIPTTSAIVDEVGTLTFQRGPRAHERARPRARRRRASARATASAIMCRNHRGFVEAVRRLLEARRPRAVPQHGVLRAAARPTSLEREEPDGAHLRRGVRRACSSDAGERPQALHRLARAGRASASDPTLEELIARRRHAPTSSPPPEPGKAMILTSGTTGTPKGASRAQPQVAGPGRRAAASASRCSARETTMIAAPLFHSWGFAHFTLGMGAVLDDRAQAQVRPRGDAVADRPAPAAPRSSSCR